MWARKALRLEKLQKTKRTLNLQYYASGKLLRPGEDGNREWTILITRIYADGELSPAATTYSATTGNPQTPRLEDLNPDEQPLASFPGSLLQEEH